MDSPLFCLILRRPFRHRPDSIMAGSIVLAAGLLTFICVQSGKVSSEVVPDGVVYTEVKKTLVKGVPAVLTCHFYRDPQAIYWKKGSNPDDASLLLLWHEGEVSGPRYNDGSCDIDENYSLVIKNVSMVDSGRYYCLVSNYLGILIYNYTDVSVVVNAIETKSQVTLQMRPYLRGVVQCTIRIRPRTVSWIKKSTTSTSDETLVIFENTGTVVKRSGDGYDDGMYNISEDYSLVINDVTVYNEGIYTCNVTDFDTGIAFQDDVLINVVAQPREPFPTMLECLHDESDLTYCSIPAETALTITCLVSEYYPDINLSFLYGSTKVESLETRELNNTDGTKNKTTTIAALGSKELYTCVASNIPGTPYNRSTSALLHDKEHFSRGVLVIVLILFAALALISLLTYLLWRKRHSTDSHVPNVEKGELQEFSPPSVRELAPENFEALEQHVNNVSMRHYEKICGLLKKESVLQTKKIIGENKTALFHTDQMLADWSQRGTSSQIIPVIQLTSETGEAKDSAWPSDEELEWISRHLTMLTKESMITICKKLNIDCRSRDFGDGEKILEGLRDWRKKKAKESVDNKHMELLLALEASNVWGLLPPLKGRFVYKVEVVNMAFQLLMHDLLPTAEALGISVTKLISYRPVFEPFHLTIGTIDLLSKLLESTASERLAILEKGDRRSIFCNKIGKIQYRRVATNGMLIYDMSYGELCSISAEMKKISEEKSTSQEREKKASTPHVDEEVETDIDHAESGPLIGHKSELEKSVRDTENREHQTGPLVKAPKDHVDLQNVLQLTDQDIADGHQSSHPIKEYALFKIWKEKPRSSVFNYRAALAQNLRGIEMTGLADEVIAGKYITEKTSREFIENMGLTEDQRRSLGKLLNLSGKDEKWHTNTPLDVISQQIYEWVADWTKEMKNSRCLINVLTKVRDTVAEVTPLETTLKAHKDLNDELVEHGFLELAREIMIIEQQLGYVEPNLMRKIANMMPQDVINQMGNLIHKSKFSKLFA